MSGARKAGAVVDGEIGIKRVRSGQPFPSTVPCDWLAFDIETANESRGSICSIGVALVTDGTVVAAGSQLIDPQCEFDWYNSEIHGLDARSVRGAPTFAQFWPQLYGLLNNNRLVAHYASFDIGGLRQAVAANGLAGPTVEVMCSWRLSKRAWPEMASYSLGWVAPALGIEFDHHEAGADAEACARIVLAACDHFAVANLDGLISQVGFHMGLLTPDSYRPITTPCTAGLHRVEGDLNADANHPLYGATVCFTGGMYSMLRREAADKVVHAGATFVDNMSTRVDFLVIGDADFVSFADGQRTGKINKLIELRDKGKSHAEVLGERDFLALLHSAA